MSLIVKCCNCRTLVAVAAVTIIFSCQQITIDYSVYEHEGESLAPNNSDISIDKSFLDSVDLGLGASLDHGDMAGLFPHTLEKVGNYGSEYLHHNVPGNENDDNWYYHVFDHDGSGSPVAIMKWAPLLGGDGRSMPNTAGVTIVKEHYDEAHQNWEKMFIIVGVDKTTGRKIQCAWVETNFGGFKRNDPLTIEDSEVTQTDGKMEVAVVVDGESLRVDSDGLYEHAGSSGSVDAAVLKGDSTPTKEESTNLLGKPPASKFLAPAEVGVAAVGVTAVAAGTGIFVRNKFNTKKKGDEISIASSAS